MKTSRPVSDLETDVLRRMLAMPPDPRKPPPKKPKKKTKKKPA